MVVQGIILFDSLRATPAVTFRTCREAIPAATLVGASEGARLLRLRIRSLALGLRIAARTGPPRTIVGKSRAPVKSSTSPACELSARKRGSRHVLGRVRSGVLVHISRVSERLSRTSSSVSLDPARWHTPALPPRLSHQHGRRVGIADLAVGTANRPLAIGLLRLPACDHQLALTATVQRPAAR